MDKKSIKIATIKTNNITLSKSNQYSDNTHITTKLYYNTYVFPNVNMNSFMELDIDCQVGKKLPDTIWHLGKYEEGYYIKHLDGRGTWSFTTSDY